MASTKQQTRPTMADLADRHRLYQLSVQNPRTEVDFVDRTYRQLRGRSARTLREDFCGTAAVCCEWVRRRKRNRAWGVDLDPDVLEWGRRHNLGALDADAAGACRAARGRCPGGRGAEPDIVLAMNCSYWLLRDRASAALLRGVCATLADGRYLLSRRLRRLRHLSPADRGAAHPGSGWRRLHLFLGAGGLRAGDRQIGLPHPFSVRRRIGMAAGLQLRLAALDAAGDPRAVGGSGIFAGDGLLAGMGCARQPDGVFVPVESGEPDAGWIAYLTAEK
jgi:hypothetical protein